MLSTPTSVMHGDAVLVIGHGRLPSASFKPFEAEPHCGLVADERQVHGLAGQNLGPP
jgi:hypothetical protein